MSFNVLASMEDFTVVSEYEPEKQNATAYQSEDELEREFISRLQLQGYEYLKIHEEKDLINNLRKQLEKLNNISFTDNEQQEIVVNIDSKTYNVYTVRHKSYKTGRDIKKTAENTIKLAPGQHNVSVLLNGNEVYSHKVFLSTGETKIIEL